MQFDGGAVADVALHIVQDVEQVDINGDDLVLAEVAEEVADFVHRRLDVAVFRGPEHRTDAFAGVRVEHFDHAFAAGGSARPVHRRQKTRSHNRSGFDKGATGVAGAAGAINAMFKIGKCDRPFGFRFFEKHKMSVVSCLKRKI